MLKKKVSKTEKQKKQQQHTHGRALLNLKLVA